LHISVVLVAAVTEKKKNEVNLDALLAVPTVVLFSQARILCVTFDVRDHSNTTQMFLMESHAVLHSPLPSGTTNHDWL